MTIAPNQYQCALCKGVFDKDRPDEVAKKEYQELYGGAYDPAAAIELICDACFEEMKPWLMERLKRDGK